MPDPRPAQPLLFSESWLFTFAAAWGAVAVPLSLHAMAGGPYALAGLATPPGHAHELLFGYALAVVAGFLVNRVERRKLVALLALWLFGRITHLAAPGSLASLACNVGFAGTVAALAAPPFLRGAKKWRNRIIGPLIIAFAVALAALELALSSSRPWLSFVVLEQAVLLFALLMMFFGGRTLAPAVAGAIVRGGESLDARVQPRIEGALIVLIAAALPLSLLPGTRGIAGVALILAGALVLVRLLRWRMWCCPRRVDLLCLGAGCGWLGVGLLLLGATRLFTFGVTPAAAAHAITVGALGTLTANMMLRTRLLHLRRDPIAAARASASLTVLMSAAALLRILADGPLAVSLAAACWSAALLLLTVLLVRYRRRADDGRELRRASTAAAGRA